LLVFVRDFLKVMQLDGTARSSMASDLFEQYTKKDGRVDGEDLIAGCTAATYAGESLHTISLRHYV
jgi:hypothetical protein